LEAQIEALKSRTAAGEAKVDAKTAGAEAATAAALAKASQQIGVIDTALGQTGPFTTGAVGSVLARIPGGTAYDLRKTVDTIKANIGFSELQAMRMASPTGGALGQVAVKELDMLQATLGNLDANQSEDQLKKNLTAIRQHYENWSNAVRGVSQDRSMPPAGGGAGAAPAAPLPGAPAPAAGAAPTRLRLDPATGRLVPAR
jgi:hypothetical protein